MRDEQRYRSRAAFKLIEINEKVRLWPSKSGSRGRKACRTVVELGSAPGSWSQVILEHLGKEELQQRGGKSQEPRMLVSVDLQHVQPFAKDVLLDTEYHHVKGDFTDAGTVDKVMELVGDRRVDAVLSDMAPNTSGIVDHDHARIMELCGMVLDFSKEVLRPGGCMLVKYFAGAEEISFKSLLRKHFDDVRVVKPGASRDESREAFFFARGFRPATTRKVDSKSENQSHSFDDKLMEDFGFS